jgi:integrase
MSKRRSRGEGSLYHWEEKGLWVGKLTLPDGRRKTRYAKTQKEVNEWLLAERGKISQGNYVPDEKLTLEAFLNRYVEDYCKNSLRPTTLNSYVSLIRKHIVPEIGNIKLTSLRADHLNQLYAKKLQAGMSNRSVEYIHGVIRRALNKAVKWGLLAKNPTDMASPPSVKTTTISTWNSDQVKLFLETIKDHRWAGIFYLACGVGMRKGEILGLPLSALEVEKGYLRVIQTLQYVPSKGLLILEPKTDKSRRMLVLPKFVVKALREHLVKRERLSKSSSWKESGLVFTTDIGTPISPRNLIRLFKSKIQEAGLPDIRFHDLRHGVASLLLEKNVHPKIVSELLGHSSVNLTLNTYSHIINPLNRVAADTMDDVVGRK